MKLHQLSINNQNALFWGPSLDQGPLPAVFYYALAAEDSLLLAPFNQPVVQLKEFSASLPLRIFSVTLPGHHPPLKKEKAIEWLSDSFQQGIDPLAPFLDSQVELIQTLIAMEIIEKTKIILSGLSRGGLIACHVAARLDVCKHILGFAPLTKLSAAKECEKIKKDPLVLHYDLCNHIPSLTTKKIRFYIGNNDQRVSTHHSFELITSLSHYAHEHRIKHGSFELIIGNSIGYQGHGTSEKTFKEGALWMFEELFYHE